MDKRFELMLFGKALWWWLRHSVFWLFMYFDEILYTILDSEGLQDLDMAIIPFALDVITVYVSLYILIPIFMNKKKYFYFFLLTFLSVIINVGITSMYIYFKDGSSMYLEGFVGSVIATLTLLVTAIAIKAGKQSYQQLKYTEQLKNEQTKLELNALKQQINPHFLFNVLNTIHIQAQSDPTQVSDTVLHLSDLLRYQIYDAGTSDSVLLQKEIDFIENYISLEKIRRDDITVSSSLSGTVPKIRITPFLFLPLVENAFKHSRSINSHIGQVTIEWVCGENVISIIVRNTIGDTHEKEEGGFGIDNLKKRLELLYPNKYELKMSIQEGHFISYLQLDLT